MDSWKETAVLFSSDEITVVRSDPYKDLVWIGDSQGRVSSYFGPLLHAYTAFYAHQSPVKDIVVSDKYVLVLGEAGVRSYSRSGMLIASNQQAMGDKLLLLDSSEFLVGVNRRVKRFTLDKQIRENGFFELDCIPEDVRLTHMSLCTPNVAIGLSNGTVQVLEPHTFDPILPKPISSHSGPITDLDSRKSTIVTCGLSQRRYGVVPDIFVTCFDVHSKRLLPPLSVSSGGLFVRLHPKAPNHAVVFGSNGQLTFLDSKNPSSLSIKQSAIQTQLVGCDTSSSGDSLVLVEKFYIHYWSATQVQQEPANSFKGLEVPNAKGNLPKLSENKPLSSVGLPYFNQELLSNWNFQITFETGFPQPDWDTVKDPLLAQRHAAVKVRRPGNRRTSSVSVPRFLSEQARLGVGSSFQGEVFVDLMKSDDSVARGKVPKIWRQMQVHYSKFGVDDFDFNFYNSTDYAGLEPLSASRRCNAILQLYRWCPAIYNYCLHTFAKNNWRELTVTGELAIVLDMLAKAKGYHCRATNFMDTVQSDMCVTNFHNFLMSSLCDEYKEIDASAPCGLNSQLATNVVSISQSMPSASWLSSDICELLPYLFISIDETSYSSSQTTPNIFPYFWIDQAGSERDVTVTKETSEGYRLQGYVAEVNDEGDFHAVAVIKVEDEWYLFNDFLVTSICENEALDFSSTWKRPCLLMYSNFGSANAAKAQFDESWKDKIDTHLLNERHLTSGNLDDPGHPECLLKKDESIPDLVALDAEFVLIRNEISEVHSDGSKNLVSPKKLSLARLSVIRENEKVLIDDMVESKLPIVDYVTAYSGIEPGDLDPVNSSFGLVARKNSTRKLWILLNSGTKFVGHALVNDFRTINLYVPPSQVVDTFNLFYDRDRNGLRRLSLKFLMWAVLGEHVQTGNHDSVQDAQSALRLYRKYQELLAEGTLDETLADVATKGQKHNYRVPNWIQNGAATPSSGSGRISSLPSTPTKT